MKVDFFIVGAPKSGTTALANFLSQHPNLCMANPKETGYFADDFRQESDTFHGSERYPFVRSEEQYQQLFSHCGRGLRGEASTNYLYSANAARNIFKHNPDAKIIVMLRNPVTFLHSLHMQFVNEAREDEPDFAGALALQDERRRGSRIPKNAICPSHYQYFDWAKYSAQIQRYFDLFERKNILIIVAEEFQKDNEKHFLQVLKLLDVSNGFIPEFKTVHGSKTARFKWMNEKLNNPKLKTLLLKTIGYKWYYRVRNPIANMVMKPKQRVPLPENLKRELLDMFEPEIIRTSRLTDIDLHSKWLEK